MLPCGSSSIFKPLNGYKSAVSRDIRWADRKVISLIKYDFK